ncbi:DUF1232 domain-containing protein, partial [Vibrio parahaemolyticus]
MSETYLPGPFDLGSVTIRICCVAFAPSTCPQSSAAVVALPVEEKLIPDNIPVIGYMDDFIILGLAVSYYATRTHRIKKAKFPK